MLFKESISCQKEEEKIITGYSLPKVGGGGGAGEENQLLLLDGVGGRVPALKEVWLGTGWALCAVGAK